MKENSNGNTNNNKKVIKKRFIILIAFVFILVIVISYYILNRGYESTDDAFIDGHVVPISSEVAGSVVKLYIKENQYVKKGTLLLEIDPRDYKLSLDQANAKLQNALIQKEISETNLDVTKITSVANYEQAVAGIDFSRSNISQTAYASKASNAELKAMGEDLNTQKQLISQASDSIEEEKANLELSEHDYDRYLKLFNEGAVSRQLMDTSFKSVAVSKARVKSAQDRKKALEYQYKSLVAKKAATFNYLKQSQSKMVETEASLKASEGKLKSADTVKQFIAISKFQIKLAKTQVKELTAAVKQAKISLADTKIYAPKNGYISKKSVETGMYADKGRVLLSIVPDDVWVIGNFKENQLRYMKAGQKVTIKVDAYPNQKYFGSVESIQRGTGSKFSLFPPENAVGSYVKVVQRIPVKIVFDKNTDKTMPLIPGMSVIPKVKTEWK